MTAEFAVSVLFILLFVGSIMFMFYFIHKLQEDKVQLTIDLLREREKRINENIDNKPIDKLIDDANKSFGSGDGHKTPKE